MKKHTMGTSLLIALSYTCMSALHADVSDAQMRSLENRVNALEQKKSTGNALNPSGRPQVRDGADLFINIDWLIWQAHENGLGYAVKTSSSQTVTNALYRSSERNLSFDWDCGFRFGFGWNTPRDGWDLSATWTWFHNKAHDDITVGSTKMLLPVFSYEPSNTTINGFRSADAKWWLKLNLIDLDLGREFFVSKWMTLRPFIGLRTGWIYQTNKVTFGKATPSSSQTGIYMKDKNNYWGLGLHSGLDSEWGLGAGFSVFAKAAASLLYGFFQIDSYETQLLSSSRNDTVNNKDSFRVDRAMTDLALGLRWDTMLSDDRFHIGLQAGWEHLMFFGQNQFKRFYGMALSNAGAFVANQGDLTIQGWTLSGRFDF